MSKILSNIASRKDFPRLSSVKICCLLAVLRGTNSQVLWNPGITHTESAHLLAAECLSCWTVLKPQQFCQYMLLEIIFCALWFMFTSENGLFQGSANLLGLFCIWCSTSALEGHFLSFILLTLRSVWKDRTCGRILLGRDQMGMGKLGGNKVPDGQASVYPFILSVVLIE